MNGWLIVVAALLVAVAAFRIWFRWFSRRPLSSVDEFAGVVDTSVDGVDVTSPVRSVRPTPPTASTASTASTAPKTVRSAIPRQRALSDAADNAGPVGPAVGAPDRTHPVGAPDDVARPHLTPPNHRPH